MHLFKRCRWLVGSEHHVEVALREALANAIIHGNHQDPEKNVYVGCIAGIDEVSIVVRDEGYGFDFDRRADPTHPQNLESSHGRGIYLMESMMDEVHFERGGAVVYMRKSAKKDQQPRLSVVATPELSGHELV
jgi:serine/threonine-protein kinase RsbW